MAITPVTVSDKSGASQGMAAMQDAAGNNIPIVSLDTSRPTYRACFTAGSLSSVPEPFNIYGSATKTVRIKKILVNGSHTIQTYGTVQLIRRSATPSGGTSTAITVGKLDTASPSSTATHLEYYTATQTTGGSVAVLHSTRVAMNLSTSVAGNQNPDWVLFDGRNNGQAIVLRGTTDGIGLTFGVTPANVDVTVEWEEDAS